jgi:hypothetical protein
LQSAVKTEKERLIKIQAANQEAVRRSAPKRRAIEEAKAGLEDAEGLRQSLESEKISLQLKQDEIYILLALSGHRTDSEV